MDLKAVFQVEAKFVDRIEIFLELIRNLLNLNNRNFGSIEKVHLVENPPLKRVGMGIFVSREWSIFVRVKCEMLDFSVVKCDLFYSRDA
jgi:hypothetical protein